MLDFDIHKEIEIVSSWVIDQMQAEFDSGSKNLHNLEWQKEVGFMALTKLAYRYFQLSESQERSTGLIKIPVDHAASLYLYEVKGIPFHSVLKLSELEVFTLLRHELTEIASNIFSTYRALLKEHIGKVLDEHYLVEAFKKMSEHP